MHRCPHCSRHVRDSERRCPFCSAPCSIQGSAPALISALVGLTLCACGGDDGDGGTTAATTTSSTTGMDSMSSTNSQTSSETTDPTTTNPSTSDPTTSSSSTSTSTSDTSSGSSAPSTSDTGGTTADTDAGTTQMSTGGDCMGPGEEICDGVCVNAQESEEHCGMCFNACGDVELCFEGECMVVTPPYGAPMPEPLWV